MPPQRHFFLTVWLVVLFIYNVLAVVIFSYQFPQVRKFTSETLPIIVSPNISPVTSVLIILFGVADVVFIIALFRWQRWGFYGYVVTNVIVVIWQFSSGYGKSIWGLAGIAILYFALNIGGDRKAWPRLK